MKKAALCLAILLLITAVSCSSQTDDYHIKNPTAAPSVATLDPNWTPMPQPTDAGGAELPGNPYDYINPERLFNMGEWMDIAGVEFRCNNVEFTKSGAGLDLEALCIWDTNYTGNGMPVDEEGNLYGNHSYTILNYTVKNTTDVTLEINLYNIGLFLYNGDACYRVTASTGYVEPSPSGNAVYTFQPGEEVDFKSVYILEDHFSDDENIFFGVESVIVDTVPHDQPDWQYSYDAYVPINKDKSEVDIYTKYTDKRDFVNPERIYNMGETVEMKGMSFRVNHVTMGEKLEGISVDRIRYMDFEKTLISSDGTFVSDAYSRIYVRANVTIKNLTEQPIKICTSAIYLSTPHSGGITSRGAAGVTLSITTDLKYDDFYRFQPGEEVTFDIYYIGHERYLTDDTLMLQFPLNMGLQDAKNPESPYDYDIFVPIKKDKSEVNVYGE